MKQISHLSLYFFKKDKKQILSFGIIILITSLILNLATVLALRIDPAYDRQSDELHSADIDMVIPKMTDSAALSAAVRSHASVAQLEQQRAILQKAVMKDFRGTDFELNILFYNWDNHRSIHQLSLIERSEKTLSGENTIYLPLYIAKFGEYALNEKITFSMDGRDFTYTVAGVVQEMQYGNASAEIMGVFLPDDPYRQLAEEYPGSEVVNYAVRTVEGTDNRTLLADLRKTVEEHQSPVLFALTSEAKKQSRMMVTNLLTMILTAFAVIVLLVSIFLCQFRIKNTVCEEMAQMGVLKSMGFTSGGIIRAIVLPYTVAALIFSAIGAAGSYVLLSSLVDVLALQAGFRFEVAFSAAALILTVALLTGMTLIFTWLAAGKIRHLQPIAAIRGMAEGNGMRKNRFAIARTPGSVNGVLMLKQMAASAQQNVLLFVVLFVITILIAFSGSLFYNVVIEPDHFMNTLSDESPDVILQVSSSDISRVKRTVGHLNGADKVLSYSVLQLKVEDENAIAFVCEDFSKAQNNCCYEGRNPSSDREIAIGNALAERLGCIIGDTVDVTYGNHSRSYRVVGLVQSVNNRGEICELTEEGLAAISEDPLRSLYVYLNEGTDAEKFIDKAEAVCGEDIVNTVNAAKKQSEAQSMYNAIVNIVIIAVFAVTILIVLLILYVIIRSMITQRRQEYGIFKAIGYSGRQLVAQTAGSLMPVTVAAALSSALLGLVYLPAVYDVIFGMIGAMKNRMEQPVSVLLLLAAAEIAVTLLIGVCLARPIKKIEAYSLIKE
ncbi:MAG: FtsX-like permease family protein [Clostridia bacterium]|nr:FtsX-like permease family protein [Clostridia bacterium]